MGVTNYDQLDAVTGRIKIVASLPTLPTDYYGADYGILTTEWRGGETVYLSSDNRIYIQQSTTGTSATWKRLLTQFATSTTSSSTSSSTSSTTSSTTSSSTSSSTSSTTSSTTSSSTSTSTSTSTSSSSSSTSSSSTTTP